MKIVDKTKENIVLFSELDPGDVFKSPYTGYLYIKTNHEKVTAVNLENGQFQICESNLKVLPIDCELVIK